MIHKKFIAMKYGSAMIRTNSIEKAIKLYKQLYDIRYSDTSGTSTVCVNHIFKAGNLQNIKLFWKRHKILVI